MRPLDSMVNGINGCLLDTVNGFSHPPKLGQMIDPAQQRVDNQNDHRDGYRK